MTRRRSYPQMFSSREKAEEEKARMRGWSNIRIRKDESPYGDPTQWYITCGGGTLCEDGYVRNLG